MTDNEKMIIAKVILGWTWQTVTECRLLNVKHIELDKLFMQDCYYEYIYDGKTLPTKKQMLYVNGFFPTFLLCWKTKSEYIKTFLFEVQEKHRESFYKIIETLL